MFHNSVSNLTNSPHRTSLTPCLPASVRNRLATCSAQFPLSPAAESFAHPCQKTGLTNHQLFWECICVEPSCKSIITRKEALLRSTIVLFSGQTRFQWECLGQIRSSLKIVIFKRLRSLDTTWNFACTITRVSTHEHHHWEHCLCTQSLLKSVYNDFQTALHCVTAQHSSSWWVLGWVYTQLLHLCNHRHDPVQPRMFHTLEAEVAFPSSHAYLISCKEAWQETHAALTHLSCRSQHLGGLRYSPALQYQPGQKIWLSSWDLPLQVDFRKLLACWLLWE